MTTAALAPRVGVAVAARAVASLASAVLAGGVLVVAVQEKALGADAGLWTGYHQAVTAPLTALLPPLGAAAVIAAVVAGTAGGRRLLPLVAAALFLAGLVVTVVVHFPINAAVATWTVPPADWAQVRDRWQAAHLVRTAATVVGAALLAVPGRRE